MIKLAAEVAEFAGDLGEGVEGSGLEGLCAHHFVDVVLDTLLGVGQRFQRGDEED